MQHSQTESQEHLTKYMTKAAKKAYLQTHPTEVKSSKIPSFVLYALAFGAFAVTAGFALAKRRNA